MHKQQEKILLYSSNLWGFGEGMFGPLFAIFGTHIGGNIITITWAWAVYLIVAGLMHILVGRLCDQYGHHRLVMIAGFALNAMFTFAYLFVHAPWQLLLVQGGIGVATALANPPWFALYAKYGQKRLDASAWGTWRGESMLMNGLAMIVGGLIVNYLGFGALFVAMGVIQSAATLYQARLAY